MNPAYRRSIGRGVQPKEVLIKNDPGAMVTLVDPASAGTATYVPRKEMVAVFDWQPRGDNQYFLLAKTKRYIDGGRGAQPLGRQLRRFRKPLAQQEKEKTPSGSGRETAAKALTRGRSRS